MRVQRATGNAAVAMTVAPGVAWQLDEIRIHLSAGGAATNLTATIDSGTHAVYDTVLITQAMNGVTDYIYKPTRPHVFGPTDELDIAYLNGGGVTYGIEVFYSAV